METEAAADVPYFLSKRWILSYLCFFGYFCQYLHRTNINIAIICMVRTSLTYEENNTNILKHVNDSGRNMTNVIATEPTDALFCSGTPDDQKEDSEGGFDWDKTQVSAMLSSYYYGVVVTQLIGGPVSIRFGAKLIITVSMIVQGTCSLLIPTLTTVSYYCLFVLRVIMGLLAGPISPAMFTIWTKWAPPNERGRLLNVSLLGSIIGVIVSLSTSGTLCVYGFDRGWGSIFYFHGILTAIYIVLWMIFAKDNPNDHPSITEAEKLYLNKAIQNNDNRKEISVPWKSILSSPAFHVLLCANMSFIWSQYILLTTIPLYMKEVLKFDIQQNGFLTSLPQVCWAITMILVGILSDIVTRNGYLSITCARRVFQGISLLGVSLCFFLITFVTCAHKAIAVVILCAGTTLLAFGQGGYYLNAVDFAPKYSGVIYGLSNSISYLSAAVAPLVVGALTTHSRSHDREFIWREDFECRSSVEWQNIIQGIQEEWNNVFYVCIGVGITGSLVFCTLSRGEIQDWAKDDVTTNISPATPESEQSTHM